MYWQSSGSPGTHWIEVLVPDDSDMTELAVLTIDHESYSPENIRIRHDTTTIKESVTLPRTKGWVTLFTAQEAEAAGVKDPRKIRIEITRCHSSGCDTRVTSVRLIGVPRNCRISSTKRSEQSLL